MSFLKRHSVIALLLASAMLFVFGCAGSSSGRSDDEGSYDSGSEYSESGSSEKSRSSREGAPEKKINKNELASAQAEAVALEKENHELRRQIFEAKNKLGIPIEQDDSEK